MPSFVPTRPDVVQRRSLNPDPHPADGNELKDQHALQGHAWIEAGAVFAPPIVHEVLRSPGQPLDLQTRAFMEPRFGHNFSHVRVHTDEKASMSARAVNALAYAVGSHIAVRQDKHSPGTPEGRRLLAHELAHVVQQSAGTGGGDPESCADVAAKRIGDGQPVNPASVGSAPVGLHRQHAEADDDWFLKLWSLKTQLEAISLTSAMRLSQKKKGVIPPIPANSPLSNQPGPSFSMLSPQAKQSIFLNLEQPKSEAKPRFGINLGHGLRIFATKKEEESQQHFPTMEPPKDKTVPSNLYGDKQEENKGSGAFPVETKEENLPFLQQRLKDALESLSIGLRWTIGARKNKKGKNGKD